MSSISVGQVAQVLLPTTSSLELNAQQGAPRKATDRLPTPRNLGPAHVVDSREHCAAKELDQFASFPEKVWRADNVLATPPQ